MVGMEIDVHDHTENRVFFFDLDDGKGFCSKSRKSLNAFSFSPKKRNYKPSFKKAEKIYIVQSKREYDTTLEVTRKANGKSFYEQLPQFNLPNVWAFYEHIGYDRKTKKFITPKETT